MKRKFTIMTHQIEQLKEEIQAKDNALINEHYEFKRLQDKEKGIPLLLCCSFCRALFN
jgi:hypothetical protein